MTLQEAEGIMECPGYYGQRLKDYETETPEYRFAHYIGWDAEDEVFYQQERKEWLEWWYSDN